MVNQNTSSYRGCRLCGSRSRLDFHHWTYSPDRGTYLCRECHNYIHQPDGARPSESRGISWVWDAVEQLIERHIEIRDEYPNHRAIMERYSIPGELSDIVEYRTADKIPEKERRRRHRRSSMSEWSDIKEHRSPE